MAHWRPPSRSGLAKLSSPCTSGSLVAAKPARGGQRRGPVVVRDSLAALVHVTQQMFRSPTPRLVATRLVRRALGVHLDGLPVRFRVRLCGNCGGYSSAAGRWRIIVGLREDRL